MILTGTRIKREMRKRHLTIKGLANKHQITQKRVREVRAHGVQGFLAKEWWFFLTGAWPGEPATNSQTKPDKEN